MNDPAPRAGAGRRDCRRAWLGSLLVVALALLSIQCGNGEDEEPPTLEEVLADSPALPVVLEAVTLARSARFDEAVVKFRRGIELDPKQERIYVNLVATLITLQKYSEAKQVLEGAVSHGVDGVPIRFHLGAVEFELGNFEVAREHFERVIHDDDENAAAHDWLGLVHWELSKVFLGSGSVDQKKLDLSIASFERAIELEPGNASFHAHAAGMYERKHDSTMVEHHYRKAIEADPNDHESKLELGSALVRLGRVDDAEPLLRSALEQTERKATVHFQLGLIHEKRNDYATARASYEQAIQLDPVDSEPYFRLSGVLQRLGEPELGDRALATFKQLKEATDHLKQRELAVVNSPTARSYYDLGVTYYKFKRRGNAVRAYQRALALDPELIPAHENLAVLFIELRNYSGAIEHALRAVEIDPARARGQSLLGRVYLQSGEFTKAETAFLLSIGADSSDPSVHFDLGLSRLQIRNLDGAAKAFEQAIVLAPKLERAHFNLAGVYYSLGEKDKAAASFRRVLEINAENTDARRYLDEIEAGKKPAEAGGGN